MQDSTTMARATPPEQDHEPRRAGRPPSSVGANPWPFRAAVAAVLLLAALLRVLPIGASLPYPGYVDEAHTIIHGADMVRRESPDPGWYDYPTLPLAVSGAVVALAELGTPSDQRDADLAWTASGDVYDDIRPPGALLGNRLVTTGLSVATVALVVLATALLTRRRVALVAGFLAAVTPALVARGMFDLVDTLATFFVVAAFTAGLACSRSRRRSGRLTWVVVAGCCAGLAAASKYPAGASIAMVVVLVGAGGGRVVGRVQRSALAVGASAVTFVALMPAVITNPAEVQRQLSRNYAAYADKVFRDTYWSNVVLTTEVGVALLLVAGVGVAVLLARRSTRVPTVAWLVYAAILLAVLVRVPFQPFRNVLSLVPFVCLAAAVGIDAAVRAAAERLPGAPARRRWVADVAVVAVVGVLAGHLVVGGLAPFYDGAGRTDSRVAAREWLEANVQPGDSVTVMAEIGMTADEVDRIPGSVQVVSVTDGTVVRPSDTAPAPDGTSYVVSTSIRGSTETWLALWGHQTVATFGSGAIEAPLTLHRANGMRVAISAD